MAAELTSTMSSHLGEFLHLSSKLGLPVRFPFHLVVYANPDLTFGRLFGRLLIVSMVSRE